MGRLNVTDLNDYCRRCDSCGSDDLVLYPPTTTMPAWHVRCDNCGEEGESCPSLWDAIDDWNENHAVPDPEEEDEWGDDEDEDEEEEESSGTEDREVEDYGGQYADKDPVPDTTWTVIELVNTYGS